jgi:hypothetical protein
MFPSSGHHQEDAYATDQGPSYSQQYLKGVLCRSHKGPKVILYATSERSMKQIIWSSIDGSTGSSYRWKHDRLIEATDGQTYRT